MALSNKLHAMLDEVSIHELTFRNRRCYRWLWYWMLSRKSLETLQNELSDLEKAIHSEKFTPQETLELAWKAEILELIISVS